MSDQLRDPGYRKAVAADIRRRAVVSFFDADSLDDNSDEARMARFSLYRKLRERLVDDDVCLACGRHTPGTVCHCENDE